MILYSPQIVHTSQSFSGNPVIKQFIYFCDSVHLNLYFKIRKFKSNNKWIIYFINHSLYLNTVEHIWWSLEVLFNVVLNNTDRTVQGSNCSKQFLLGSNCSKQLVLYSNCSKQYVLGSNCSKQFDFTTMDQSLIISVFPFTKC